METFVAVAELKGFARAARKLGLSAPRVTRLVAALEARLGVELLHRTTRSVSLTDAGARYLAQARGIVDAVHEAERRTLADRPVPSGRFVVTAPVVFGRLEVAPLFSRFLARWPAVRGELLLLDRIVSLVDEGVDLAVRIGELEDSSLRARVIGATRRVVVASPKYLAEHGRPRRPEDVAKHQTAQLTPLGAPGEWHFQRGGRPVRVRVQPAFVTNSADAAITHAAAGGGLAMVLSYQVAAHLKAGTLETVLDRFEPPPRPIQLVYPAARQPSATVRAFIDFAVGSRARPLAFDKHQ
ncbi:MAG: LysR family transcriptional regulator [Myxococcaceae bacterium]|nr:LysR family transcriptional regulator [Myxococcaceae bacterium]